MEIDEPSVGIVGSGPAVEAIEAAVGDVAASIHRPDEGSIDAGDLLCVVDVAGSESFEHVRTHRSDPWMAVELGGIGGVPVSSIDGAIAVFGPGKGCFRCLGARVRANLDGADADDARTTRSDARLVGAVAGRTAVEHLHGQGQAGRVVELPYAEHELHPVPTCSCKDAADRALAWGDESATLEAAVDRAERTIDGRLGLINSIGEAESFPAPYYLTQLADTAGFSDAEAGPQAAGVAVDWNEAFMKAAGEALERYAAGVYRTDTFRRASTGDLDSAIDPAAFVRPDGYPGVSADESIQWIRGERLGADEPIWLPAEYVVFPPPEERFKPAITTGLGLGTSTVGATLSGLYEVIERDATMLAWYSTFEPLGLDIDDEGFRTLVRRARSEGLEVTPLLLTQNIDVPVVSVAVHREHEWPKFAVGSGADLDPASAARSALAEALQNWMELRGMGPDRAAEEETSIGRYSHFPTEVQSFVEPHGSVAAGELAPEPLDGRAELDAVVDAAEAAGLNPAVARLTTIDLEEVGFETVRVLAPTAQPLFIDERCFGERARTVPRELGYRPQFDRPPHPYP